MPKLRALPINQLMPAVSSYKPPAATRCLGGRPEKNERPHPITSPHAGHPIHHHVAGPSSVDPDKAGRRHATLTPFGPRALAEASHDLNRAVFASLRADPVCGGSSSASRSFVLAALRALHLDPDLRSTAPNTERK